MLLVVGCCWLLFVVVVAAADVVVVVADVVVAAAVGVAVGVGVVVVDPETTGFVLLRAGVRPGTGGITRGPIQHDRDISHGHFGHLCK